MGVVVMCNASEDVEYSIVLFATHSHVRTTRLDATNSKVKSIR